LIEKTNADDEEGDERDFDEASTDIVDVGDEGWSRSTSFVKLDDIALIVDRCMG
jgi:hypothetical protein